MTQFSQALRPRGVLAALPLDLDDQVRALAGIQQEVGALQAAVFRDRPLGLVHGHARDAEGADVALEGGLVVVGSVGHDGSIDSAQGRVMWRAITTIDATIARTSSQYRSEYIFRIDFRASIRCGTSQPTVSTTAENAPEALRVQNPIIA